MCRAEFAKYWRDRKILELTGMPWVSRKGDEYRAAKITIDLDTEEIVLEGEREGHGGRGGARQGGPGARTAAGARGAAAEGTWAPKGTLSLEGLAKSYGAKQAVREVTFSMESGEVVGLLGPNGAGKTTVFYMVVGFIRPTSGRIWLDGRDVTGPADVPAGAPGHRLPAPGALGVPQALGRGQHRRHPRDPAAT